MRRLLPLALLLLALPVGGDVDTKDGTAIAAATSTIDSVATVDTADGQTIAGAAACATQTIDVFEHGDNADRNFLVTHTRGMSLTTTAFGGGTKDVHRIVVRASTGEANSPTFTCRFDDDTDMSSEYMGGEATGSGTGIGQEEISIVFPSASRPTVSQSTVYYWFCHTDTSMSVGIDYADSGGGAGLHYYTNGGAVWTGLSTISWDLWYELYLCD